MSEYLYPRPELPEWLEEVYADLDKEITVLVEKLKELGFKLNKDNSMAQSYIFKISDTDDIKVIIYSVGGHFLGRAGISVQGLTSDSVIWQAKFDTFGYQYANIARRTIALVEGSLPQ